ncbi:MAG: GDP-fucose synthetase [Chloroflexi bacterium]|nr:GDP-fucose synthetase [Chloroflexota bacterium]|tara:strand:+ start:1066 stop:2016 length:951 start_codon:yes stop_codon:yes gene_type:complete
MKTIFIAGHNGMVGSAVRRSVELYPKEYDLVTESKENLDLTNSKAVHSFIKINQPDCVVIAAAKVGGIVANSSYPADFIYENIMIQTNLMKACLKYHVKQVLFLGSSCIYPKECPQPIKEEYLLSDYLEKTNESYAIAKIAGLKMCEAFNKQFKTDFRSLMPTNLYGANDNFHDLSSHVIPGLMNRMHNAKLNNDSEVVVWGSGEPMREFLYVDDLAEVILEVMSIEKEAFFSNLPDNSSHLNVGYGKDISIADLSKLIKEVVGFEGEIIFDKSKPDGTPRKLLDTSILNNFNIYPKTKLRDGLKKTYQFYLESNN